MRSGAKIAQKGYFVDSREPMPKGLSRWFPGAPLIRTNPLGFRDYP